MLGEWWIANPSDGTEEYAPPCAKERVPGILQDVGHGHHVLETISFLRGSPLTTGSSTTAEPDEAGSTIWGTDREGRSFSLFGCRRVGSTSRLGSIAQGHEDWSVAWLSEGNGWVTSDEVCVRAWIQTDDLRAWALFRRSAGTSISDSRDAIMIDLREEVIGETDIGDVHVSLVHVPRVARAPIWDSAQRHLSFDNAVNWRLEGSVTLESLRSYWVSGLERFMRFLTMQPSVVNGADCELPAIPQVLPELSLRFPRLPRDHSSKPTGKANTGTPAHEYMVPLSTFQDHNIDPLTILQAYWNAFVDGNWWVAMTLLLESQDRLLSSGADSALLNAVRAMEAHYRVEYPNASTPAHKIGAQTKIDETVRTAGAIGHQIQNTWPGIDEIGVLRRDAAHGNARPKADFGVRCLGGSIALQWILRRHLLTRLGIEGAMADSIIASNARFRRELRNLQTWHGEL